MIVVAKISIVIRENKPFTNKIANRQEKTKKYKKIIQRTAPVRSSVHSCMREKAGKNQVSVAITHPFARTDERMNE